MIDYCVVRHKASGELMPQIRRGKGYSWWNPSHKDDEGYPKGLFTKVPRLFVNRKQAQNSINQWFSIQNGRYKGYTNPYGEDDYDIIDKPDDRKKEDLEIVPITLILNEPINAT